MPSGAESRGLMSGDLASVLLRKSIGSMTGLRVHCSSCRRTPLGGELMHRLEDDRSLCTLCLQQLGEHAPAPVRSERVPAGERRVALLKSAA